MAPKVGSVRPAKWDARTEKWIEIHQLTDSLVEHREVANPKTGVFRQPPEGVSTRPKNR